MRSSPTVQMAAATSCESKRTSAYSDDLRVANRMAERSSWFEWASNSYQPLCS